MEDEKPYVLRTYISEMELEPEQDKLAELYALARNITYIYVVKCLRRDHYDFLDRGLIGKYDDYDFNALSRHLTQWRKTHPVVSQAPYKVMNAAFEDVKHVFYNHRDGICGRPRMKDLKDPDIKQTFQLFKNLNGKPFIEKLNKKWGRTYLNRKFKWVKLELKQEWDNPCLKKLTIKKIRHKWHYIAVYEVYKQKHFKGDGSVCGIDRNANRTLAYHNGEFKDLPKKVELYDKKIAAIDALLEKKQEGSAGHLKLSERRQDYFDKKTNCIAGFVEASAHDTDIRFDKAVVEDINMKEIKEEDWGGRKAKGKRKSKSKRETNRKMANANHGLFIRKLEERTEVVKVPAEYTSQDCPNPDCGHRSRSNRKEQEVFHCSACTRKVNADVNAAINIRKRGLLAAGQIPESVKGRIAASNGLATEPRLAEALETGVFQSGKLSRSSPSNKRRGKRRRPRPGASSSGG